MKDFDAGSYSDLWEQKEAREIWNYLNGDNALIRLETATYLKRPALEGLQEQLIEKFGDLVREDRWKRMIGRMTRQIMESKGYHLDQTGVRIRVGDVFKSAARYKK